MRRLLFAAFLAPALLAGCGGVDPAVETPLIRDTLRDFARAVVNNDKERIASYILPNAGLTGSPLRAKDWDDPKGRETIIEGNRRDMRKIFKDSGILKEPDVDLFLGALRIFVHDKKNATVRFEIAGGPGRRPEDVMLRLIKTDRGWRIGDYFRELK